MSSRSIDAVIYSCDECGVESQLRFPSHPPINWRWFDNKDICSDCIGKKECGHYQGTIAKVNCDICRRKRCPDCYLLLEQERRTYSRNGNLVAIHGHTEQCEWVSKVHLV